MSLEYFQDVVMHRTQNIPREFEDKPDLLPISRDFQISNSILIGRIPFDLSPSIFKSCQASGHNLNATRQYGQLYSFIKKGSGNSIGFSWDEDKELQICIALSRLIKPTSVSLVYSARIIFDENQKLRTIIPGPVHGPGSAAFVSPKFENNDWLTQEDCEKLKVIFENFKKCPLKGFCFKALWFHEYASRLCELDVRWTLVATGLESLVHTDRFHSTRQFTKRLSAISKEIGFSNFSEPELSAMYDNRSILAHGGNLNASANQIESYDKMEFLLRETIKYAILHPDYANFLNDKVLVKTKWPI